MERGRRTSGEFCIISIDIDNFKEINEKHGHAIGDEVLQIVANIIREKCRPYDCIGRWDGDQFSMAFPGIVSADAEKITRRILTGVQSTNISLPDGTALEVRLSAGIAASQNINAYAEIDSFIQSAVQAISNSKQNPEDKISVIII